MKRHIIPYSLFIALLFGCISCNKFLDREPETALTQQQVYSKLENIEPLLSGLLTNWRDIHKDRGGFVFQLGTDETQQGAYQVMTDPDQSALDKYGSYLAASNNALTGQWNPRWPIVSAAAQAVFALENLKDSSNEGKRKELLGEASFIRAAMMFELTQYWGRIPIIDAAKLNELGTGRQPLKDIYTQITTDLITAVEDLPETQADKKNITKYAALSLLGKVYLYAPDSSGFRDYNKAAGYFKQVIDSHKYQLVANFADLFDPFKPNSTESIYEFQFNNVYPDNNQIQWQMGSRALANIDGNCYFGGYDLLVPTKYCYSDKKDGGIWETGDVRKDASIRYDFTYHDSIHPTIPAGFGGDELDPHVKKYEDPRTQGVLSFWYSGKDVFYLRYADILLNYAECLNELGNTADAVAIVNDQVRKRAFGGTLPDADRWSASMSQEEFRTQILDERMRELCFEGWRRMDLIRSGKFVDLIKARNKWAKESGTIQTYNELYPIPLTEILQNSDIPDTDQNPGYNH